MLMYTEFSVHIYFNVYHFQYMSTVSVKLQLATMSRENRNQRENAPLTLSRKKKLNSPSYYLECKTLYRDYFL